MSVADYATAAPGNTSLAPEGMAPSAVNNAIRSVQGDLAAWYRDAAWIEFGAGDGSGDGSASYVASYVDATGFLIEGADVVDAYHVGRAIRIQVDGDPYLYGHISAVALDGSDTAVEAELSDDLAEGTLRVWLAAPTVESLPRGIPLEALESQEGSGLFGFSDDGDPIPITVGSGLNLSGGVLTSQAAGLSAVDFAVTTITASRALVAADRWQQVAAPNLQVTLLLVRHGSSLSTAIAVTVPDAAAVSEAGAVFQLRVADDQTGAVSIQRETNGQVNGGTSVTLAGPGAWATIYVQANAGTAPTIVVIGDTTEAKTVAGDQAFSDDVSIGGTLGVTGNVGLDADLEVDGNLEAHGTAVIDGDVNIGGGLSVAGTFAPEALNVTEDASVGGDLEVTGSATVDDLFVQGAATLATALAVTEGGTGADDANEARANINQGAVALTDATTIATDCALGNVFTVTLGGNRTLGNPTNAAAGATYCWIIRQDGTGNRTLALGSNFKVASGDTWAASTAANAYDVLAAVALSSSVLLVSWRKGYTA